MTLTYCNEFWKLYDAQVSGKAGELDDYAVKNQRLEHIAGCKECQKRREIWEKGKVRDDLDSVTDFN